MSNNVDVVIGLQYGDEGKGKVTYDLLSSNRFPEKSYDFCLRFNGGSNAGHTIYRDGKKLKVHQLPEGMLLDIPSGIGRGCVVNIDKLISELAYIKDNGIEYSNLFIDWLCPVVTDEHVERDSLLEETGEGNGSTKSGIGPCYADHYGRRGKLVRDLDTKTLDRLKSLGVFTTDLQFHFSGSSMDILAVGAQGYWLDIHNRKYPYVSSSHVGIEGVLISGIHYTEIRHIFGVIKPYETYVGNNPNWYSPEQSDVDNWGILRELGGEYGVTTGRPRQLRPLHLGELISTINHIRPHYLVVNKMDVLEEFNIKYRSELSTMLMNTANNIKLICDGINCKYIESRSPEFI